MGFYYAENTNGDLINWKKNETEKKKMSQKMIVEQTLTVNT